MIELGDYVSAGAVPDNHLVQGVFIRDNEDGVIWLQEWMYPFGCCRTLCYRANAVRVLDENLFPSTRVFVRWVREGLVNDWLMIS